MQMIEANITQRSTLPLPSATLIIDLRSEENDDIIQSLEVEIADLANEMGFLHHWRYLPDFLSFLAISPLSPEEVDTLRPGKAAQNGHQPSSRKIEKSSQSSFQ